MFEEAIAYFQHELYNTRKYISVLKRDPNLPSQKAIDILSKQMYILEAIQALEFCRDNCETEGERKSVEVRFRD